MYFAKNFGCSTTSACEIEYDTDNSNDGHDDQCQINTINNFNAFCQNTFNSIICKKKSITTTAIQTSLTKPKSLREKLIDIYLEEEKTFNRPFLNYSTNLLEKLIKREANTYNRLVLNLYAAHIGYSIGFNICSSSLLTSQSMQINKIETKLLAYDEQELLAYVNSSEIPPVMIDLIDRLDVNLFYDGCIILEIRDHRQRSVNSPSYALLQPSMQTLLSDLNSITNDGNFIWTQEDKYALESQLILASTQQLCLHPSPMVSIIKNKIFSNRFKLNDRRLKRNISRFSSTYMNRSAKWSEFKLPSLFNILKIRKKYSKSNQVTTTKETANLKPAAASFGVTSLFVDSWPPKASTHSNALSQMRLPKEDMLFVKRFSSQSAHLDKPPLNNDLTLYPIQEIILEAVDKASKNNYSRLLIKRRSSDGIYFCQLSLKKNDQSNDVLFELGLQIEAEKYISQYIKIFTEEGRRAVSLKQNLLEQSLPAKESPVSTTKQLSSNDISNKSSQFDFNSSIEAWSNEMSQELKYKNTVKF